MTCATCGEYRGEQLLTISLGGLGVRQVSQLAPCACVRKTLAFLARPLEVATVRAESKTVPITSARRRRVAIREDQQ